MSVQNKYDSLKEYYYWVVVRVLSCINMERFLHLFILKLQVVVVVCTTFYLKYVKKNSDI